MDLTIRDYRDGLLITEYPQRLIWSEYNNNIVSFIIFLELSTEKQVSINIVMTTTPA